MPKAFRNPDYEPRVTIMAPMPGRYVFVPSTPTGSEPPATGRSTTAEVRRKTKELGQRVYRVYDARDRDCLLGLRVPFAVYEEVLAAEDAAKDADVHRAEAVVEFFHDSARKLCPGMTELERTECFEWAMGVVKGTIKYKHLSWDLVRRCMGWMLETGDESHDLTTLRVCVASIVELFAKYTRTDYDKNEAGKPPGELETSQLGAALSSWRFNDRLWSHDWAEALEHPHEPSRNSCRALLAGFMDETRGLHWEGRPILADDLHSWIFRCKCAGHCRCTYGEHSSSKSKIPRRPKGGMFFAGWLMRLFVRRPGFPFPDAWEQPPLFGHPRARTPYDEIDNVKYLDMALLMWLRQATSRPGRFPDPVELAPYVRVCVLYYALYECTDYTAQRRECSRPVAEIWEDVKVQLDEVWKSWGFSEDWRDVEASCPILWENAHLSTGDDDAAVEIATRRAEEEEERQRPQRGKNDKNKSKSRGGRVSRSKAKADRRHKKVKARRQTRRDDAALSNALGGLSL